MLPCRAHESDVLRSGVVTPWRRALVLWTLVCLACAAPYCASLARDDQTPGANAIRQGCAVEHARYCAHEAAGTSADRACLRQHHLSLAVKCRDLLRPPAPDNEAAPADGTDAAGPGGR